MKIAIAVFAKTIGLSPVKTRLAADIGQEKAETFYQMSVTCVQEILEAAVIQNPKIFPHWVLAEEDAPTRSEWNTFPALWTGEGGLGERLSNVSHELFKNYDVVILIGTDSPQMSAKRLLQTVLTLEVNPGLIHVAGPARDGGFWLWGSHKPMPLEVWKSVTYSADTTLEELVKATNDYGHNVHIDHKMQDVDVLENLITLQKELEQKSNILLPAQIVLLKWLQARSPTFQV